MTIFLFLLIQDWEDISCPTPSPTGFWLGRPRVSPVITGYPTLCLESFINFVSIYCLRFMCAVQRLDCTKLFIPIPLLSVVIICFATFISCLRVLISYFLVAIWCFWLLVSCIIKGVSCFHTWILHISSKYDLKWYFIIHSNQSYISVQIALNLVCKPFSSFICQLCNRLLIET